MFQSDRWLLSNYAINYMADSLFESMNSLLNAVRFWDLIHFSFILLMNNSINCPYIFSLKGFIDVSFVIILQNGVIILLYCYTFNIWFLRGEWILKKDDRNLPI